MGSVSGGPRETSKRHHREKAPRPSRRVGRSRQQMDETRSMRFSNKKGAAEAAPFHAKMEKSGRVETPTSASDDRQFVDRNLIAVGAGRHLGGLFAASSVDDIHVRKARTDTIPDEKYTRR